MNVRILIVSVERHPKDGLGDSASRVVLSPRGALKAVDSLNRLRLDQSSTFQKVISPSSSCCYFLLDRSPKLITPSIGHWVFNLFATEFCPWNQWPFQQAKALAEDFPNVVIAKSNQEVEKLQGGNRAVSFDLDLINDLDEYMKTCLKRICPSLRFKDLYTFMSYEPLLCWWL